MAFEPRDVLRLLELSERQVEGLRALRREAKWQTELLEQLVDKLASLEQTQFS